VAGVGQWGGGGEPKQNNTKVKFIHKRWMNTTTDHSYCVRVAKATIAMLPYNGAFNIQKSCYRVKIPFKYISIHID